MRSIQKGELINLNNQALIRVKDIRNYSTFEEMLSKEDTSQILPGSNPEEVLKLLKSIYPPNKEKMGVLVLEVELVRRKNK